MYYIFVFFIFFYFRKDWLFIIMWLLNVVNIEERSLYFWLKKGCNCIWFVMEGVLDGGFGFLIFLEVVVVDVKNFSNYLCWVVLFFLEGDLEVFIEFDMILKDLLYVDYIRKFLVDV